MISLLVGTYSRGVLIAVFLAVIVSVLPKFRYMSTKQIILLFVVVFVMVGFFSNAEIDTDFMLSGLSTGSGRTEIWSFFFDKMDEGGIFTYLFGFGPGDILRISSGTSYDGLYSHSTILDYIFSYGFFGFCLLLYMLLRSLSVAIKSRNSKILGLVILTIFVYSTHGNSANLNFHVLIGLAYSLSVFSIKNKNKCNFLGL